MSTQSTHYDVIIIGSGAGGGTLARHLAPSGKSILLLERGDWLPREQENWDADEVFVKNRYVPKDTWYDKNGKPFQPGVHYFVGGATKMYGAALYRLRERGLRRAEAPRRHLARLADLLRRDGALLHQGRADVPGARRARRRSHRAASQRALSLPGGLARAAHPAAQRRSGARRLSSVSHALRHHAQRSEHALQRCASAARTATAFPASSTPSPTPRCSACVPRSSHPNVTLLTNARALKLNTNAAGSAVTEVVVERDGQTETYQGGIVVVSCGAANSAKLLLLSANDKHPHGLANGSDQVGRNYMYHNSVAVLAISKEPNPTVFQKTLGLNDFYFGMDGFEYPDGQHPDGRQVAGADVSRARSPSRRAGADVLARRRGEARRRLLALDRGPAAADNRVTLESDGSIRLSYTPNNQVPKQKLYDKLKSMLNHLGMHPIT